LRPKVAASRLTLEQRRRSMSTKLENNMFIN
jgi:hypothetical protein